ncbi:CPCC family cysteine-rich protein [Winogradskyella sp. MH6]|uniref:CPCC family cysteine-rich protein n=1 Tax=Winogradskyella sp. MH6 TaxID=2929510 RepID=UPI001FB3F504|nr:CPCC family cysteine-rich protein [Winogradskyella sp. MH6]
MELHMESELQCPCCDYYTLSERGVYDICPICFWEDDAIDITELDKHSGPNHITLREGRLNFEKYGACDSTMVKNVIPKNHRKRFKSKKRIVK